MVLEWRYKIYYIIPIRLNIVVGMVVLSNPFTICPTQLLVGKRHAQLVCPLDECSHINVSGEIECGTESC